ncbi:hypothetical protein QL285_044684 [Trifolium repens]|nr:hypothetical protein QL285_044684 [Trifolium repens]
MFWEENWLGNFNLCSELEDLYRIAADCNITVADKSINRGTRLRWNWQWVRQLNDSEMIRKSEPEGLLSTIVLQEGAADEFCWVQDGEHNFSVRDDMGQDLHVAKLEGNRLVFLQVQLRSGFSFGRYFAADDTEPPNN